MVTIPPETIERVRAAQHVTVLTGAGTSAESGVPTFRDAQTGLWAQYDPQELATPQAFRRNPKLVWEWYQWRRSLVAEAEPNPAHHALAELERLVPTFTLITQNVDGLHQEAGNRQVVELHGNLRRSKCMEEDVVIDSWEETGEVPPRCPRCGAYLRPDVVWFGESLPADAIDAAVQAATACDVFLSVGTSTVVQPAASLPFKALYNDATVVEINPDATPLTDHADHVLRGPAGEVLPALVDGVRAEG